jgi:cytidyltransferase-like protein
MSTEDLDAPQKNVLGRIYCRSIRALSSSTKAIGNEMGTKNDYVDGICSNLAKSDLLKEKNGEWELTDEGRRQLVVVMVGGVFDIIHPGHLYTLSNAKNLGDVLVVSIATNKTVNRMKGRDPLNGEAKRVELVSALRMVDLALLGSETDMFDVVNQVKPDVIALGYDQRHDVDDLSREVTQRGLRIKVVRFDSPMPTIKSSSIIKNSESVEDI